MNTATRLGAYALGLAVVFGGTWGVGNLVGPPAEAGRTQLSQAGHDMSQMGKTAQRSGDDTPGGLQISQNGYTLNPLTTLKPGEATDFRFTVTGPDGKPVTAFDVEHEKRLHFIVVSRDLGSFQHVHPEMSPDGAWTIKLTVPAAGAYRAYADFKPTGGEGLTLGADLLVAGDYQPTALTQASRTASVDGYTVTLDGDLVPGKSSKLTLKVSKDGKPVTDLQPYLAAYGHLVALRAGDLAYLHVHPDGAPGDGKTQPGPDITFFAEVPSSGDYRLFLDFQHGGVVRTADFTVRAGQGAAATTPTTPATPEETSDHDSTPHGH